MAAGDRALRLTTAQRDRASGAVLGGAAGDALGAAYEFGSAPLGPEGPRMIGGGLGGFAPGEWTDDTIMAWCVLDVASTGADLRDEAALTEIARRLRSWLESGPADIGIQTGRVLRAAGREPQAAALRAAAADLHAQTGRTAGNGSLVRSAPVALAHLGDPDALVEAARAVSLLTHPDEDAQDACVLWSFAIRHAVLEGELDVRAGLDRLSGPARTRWVDRIGAAEARPPSDFTPNGWVVTALQAAWSAISHTSQADDGRDCAHLVAGLEAAVAAGDDTDSVAAVAGALLGARWGASAVPARWRRILHGYPGLRGEQLVHLAELAAGGGRGLTNGWPTADRLDYSVYHHGEPACARHPYDEGVWLGDARAAEEPPPDVTAVVSLCLMGSGQVPAGLEHHTVRLLDTAAPEDNPNLDFVLADVAEHVAALREEGHVVLVHCVAAHSRTPAVGIAYAVQVKGAKVEDATREVCAVLPAASPNAGFREALRRLGARCAAPAGSASPPVEQP